MTTQATDTRVLLVEDSAEDALLFQYRCSQIEGCNWKISHVTDFASACDAISTQRYDLYFFDYRLGPHHGIELIHEMLKLGITAPTILITGLEDDKIGEAALTAGATDFLSKQDLSPVVIERTARYATIRHDVEMRLKVRAQKDSLTGTFNRAHFMSLATTELTRAHRFKQHLSLVMLDIDHFKVVNDELGHQVGDQAINEVVACCRKTLRDSDVICRYGGDEFVILLPQTSINGAKALALRIHNDMHSLAIAVGNRLISITVSIGVACMDPLQNGSINELIETADKAMYRAKKQGRNRVETAKTLIQGKTT